MVVNLHCPECSTTIALPASIPSNARHLVESAFENAHIECDRSNACPKRDPGCDNGGECHDACVAPAASLVDLLVRFGGDVFEAGDLWQDRAEVEDFVRAVSKVAVAEAEVSRG